VGGDRRRGDELKGSEGSWVRNDMRREGKKTIISPRGDRRRRVMEGGEEKEFTYVTYEVAEGTSGIECEGENEDLRRVEMGDDWFIAEFSMCCFIVHLAYTGG
jgi:hypothetical protein